MPAPIVLLCAKYLTVSHSGNNGWKKITAIKAATSSNQSFMVKVSKV